MAQDNHPEVASQTIEVRAATREYSDNGGALRSLTAEYKLEHDDITLLVAPSLGERVIENASDYQAVRGAATLYANLAEGLSSRTSAAVAEDKPVFVKIDLSQDFTVKAFKNTTITAGARYAEYFGDTEVTFLSLGARYYFRGGSVSYCLSRIDPEGVDSFLAHLVNIAISDKSGRGATQLWLSKGSSPQDRDPLLQDFSGDDYGFYLRRVQPLGDRLDLLAGFGLTSYDRPGNRVTGTEFGLGLRLVLD